MNQIRLSGAVMTHPCRIATAKRLAVAASVDRFEVVVDPEPDGPPTGLRTAVKAWERAPEGATHRLVLEDDAELSAGFAAHAERAAAAAPHAAIAFFANWCSRSGAAVRLGALAGARWVRPPAEYMPMVALLLPTDVGRGYAEFARATMGTWPGDVLMARYLRAAGVPTFVTVPNLVEHGGLPSLAANDGHGVRLSACYRSLSPDANWNLADLAQPSAVPLFKAGMALCAVAQSDGTWQTLGAMRAMRRLGVAPQGCEEQLNRALAAQPVLASALGAELDDAVLTAFWQTAYLTGHVSHQVDRVADPAAAAAAWITDPLVDQALATLGPGGLCLRLGPAELTRLRSPLRDLAYIAAAAGASLGTRTAGPGKTRRSEGGHSVPGIVRDACVRQTASERGAGQRCEAGRSVLVVSRGEPLARCLVADLADRGFVVSSASPDPDTWANNGAALRDTMVVSVGAPGVDADALGRLTTRATDASAHRVIHIVGSDPQAEHAGPGRRPCDRTPGIDSPEVTILRVGAPYGPGLSDPVSEMVESALMRRPITVDVSRVAPIQLIHVWDLAEAVERVLTAEKAAAVYDVCDEQVVTHVDIAHAITRAVAAVPVKLQNNGNGHNAPVRPGLPLSAEQISADLGWSPMYRLAEGIKTVAQWLAYEAV